jgi:hypothetical protein
MGRLDDFDEELGASLVLGRHWSNPRKGGEEPLSFFDDDVHRLVSVE